MEWRVSGIRRWLPVVLLASALVNLGLRARRLADPAVGTLGDVLVLVLTTVLAAVALVWTLAVLRARVTLTASGLAVRRLRRRLIAYDQITRVYRDRLASGAIALMLAGDRKVVLPAPVAGLGVPGAAVDEAVEQIRARLPQP